MAIDLPGDVAVDVRNPIVGNSFTWYDTEPAAAKKTIVIHATASQAEGEDAFTMADYHVNHNGWGGIGVHFVVTKDTYPGRPGQTPAGAHVQYAGDLLTIRAGVANNNQNKVHIEISGLFTPGNSLPSEAQLRATRKLIEFLLAPNNLLPSLNFPSQVTYHQAVAILPDGATSCPGWEHPKFQEWFGYLQGGAEPSWFQDQQPAPAPAPVVTPQPAPEPTPAPVEPTPAPVEIPVEPVDNRPEWERSWTPVENFPAKVVAVPSADVYDFAADKVVKSLPGGEPVKNIAGVFTVKNTLYARTQWSVDNSKWNGIMVSELSDIGEGGTSAPAPTTLDPQAPPVDGVQPPEPEPVHQVFDDEFDVAPATTPQAKVIHQAEIDLSKFWDFLIGLLLSPLRLVGKLLNRKN